MIEGTIVKECNNRFLCEVNIDGENEIVYLPSSCKLENFGNYVGCKALLRETLSKKARTRYSLFAIIDNLQLIIVDLKEGNRIIERALNEGKISISEKGLVFQREYCIDGYKSDFCSIDQQIIIEVKSVITDGSSSLVNIVKSDRAIRQLQQLKMFAEDGRHVYYVLIAMRTGTDKLILPEGNYEYCTQLRDAIDSGVIIKGYSIRFKNNTANVDKEIAVLM